jgi:hypothetical protein
MTVYEMDYRNRLNEMLDNIIRKFGFEDSRTISFAEYVDKYMDYVCYQSRETMENIYRGMMNSVKA